MTALVTILMFLIMVSLHEFGHFFTAKLMNFKILEYSIGFGPAIFKSKNTETQYSVRCIPFGGYCKFDGDDSKSDDPRAFCNQAPWKRIIVLVAGGLINIVLGFIIFIIIVAATSTFSTNVINTIVPGSYLEQAGIQPGDEIVKINNHTINFYNDITLYTDEFKKDTDAQITVKRNGKKIDTAIKPTEEITEAVYQDDGIEYTQTINGNKTTNFYKYSDTVQKDNSKIGKTDTSTRYIIGFSPKIEKVTFLNVWGQAWNETKFVVKLVYVSLWGMITGKIGVDQMSGPVGIVKEVNNAVNSGSKALLYILNLTALLTINLGVFNLLPLPALDGGRLLFVIVEIIRRKPIPPEKEGYVHAAGMLLLFALIIFVTYNDIVKLFK